jgi:hypothetical protein
MELQLETGDATSKVKEIRRCQLEVGRPPVAVTLSLVGASGTVNFADWPRLVEQVKAAELVKRHRPESLEPPLREIANVIQQISSTPTYQLFLAAIDIAERIDLVSESPPVTVKRRFMQLDKWTPSITGAGGLFFVPHGIVSPSKQQALQELLINNKLCLVALDDMKRYYVPYATPIGFIVRVDRDAEHLWDEVRTLYNTFRFPA